MHITKISPHDKLIHLIEVNPFVLLLIEYFELPLLVGHQSVGVYCRKNGIHPDLFIAIASLYFRLPIPSGYAFSASELPWIVKFLKNSHQYYLNEKYREVLALIHQMHELQPDPELALVEKFFEDYMAEVREHLAYEENVAFPYFLSLTEGKPMQQRAFSAEEYLNHHSDIETKLADLKQLLLVHLAVGRDYVVRRRTIQRLIELEFDLAVHTRVEEELLVPLVVEIEKQGS
ncbi:MAG: hemerythrin domain-containing protein [Bacteroidales bacterium]